MESYLAARAALLASAEPGLAAANRLAALTDEAVRALARAASSRFSGRFALAALGGWGAGALLPNSDLDLLVLSDATAGELKPFVEAMLYPLWDAGLAVGHQVRSPRDQRRAMRGDLATCTAALTARPVAGDEMWADSVLAHAAADAQRRSRSLLGELAARPRPGSPYLLEPDLKEGAGGRRDYDELTWTAAVLTGRVQHGPGALAALGILTAAELETLSVAAETVAAARWRLARAGEGAGAGNRMTLDASESLPPGLPSAVQRALAETALVLARARRRAAGEAVGPDVPIVPDAVFALLDAGEAALPALEEVAQSGRLSTLAPGFRALMTLRRPGLGHELTVGAHSLRVAALVTHPARERALDRSAATIEHPRALQVAALAHDVGKVQPGPGHAEAGAIPAELIARRFGLSDAEAAEVSDLVRRHLALAEAATRIDLDDEDAILSAAARVGRRELLAPLHLLTAADSLATGPATWTPWKAALVGSLVARLDAALSDDVDGAGLATRGEAVRATTLSGLDGAREAERSFIEFAPLRYLASRTPAGVARDARLIAELSASSAPGEARIAVSPGPAPETYALTVVTADRTELLARIAGAIALAGLDILAVDAYGAPGELALDSFVVASATLRPITTETFTLLERLLGAALRDRLELQARLAERRRHYPARTQAPITVQVIATGFDTAVRVTAPDRPGLLHDLARAVSATDLNIRWAKVLTVGGMAIDTFHVVGPEGGPVHDDGVIGHLSMRLREVR